MDLVKPQVILLKQSKNERKCKSYTNKKKYVYAFDACGDIINFWKKFRQVLAIQKLKIAQHFTPSDYSGVFLFTPIA